MPTDRQTDTHTHTRSSIATGSRKLQFRRAFILQGCGVYALLQAVVAASDGVLEWLGRIRVTTSSEKPLATDDYCH